MNPAYLARARKEARRTFNLGENPTQREVQGAFRKAAHVNHPDKGGETEKMARVNQVHQILQTPQTKEEKHYNQFYDGFIF